MIETIKCICNNCKKDNFISIKEIREKDYIKSEYNSFGNKIENKHIIEWECGRCFSQNKDII